MRKVRVIIHNPDGTASYKTVDSDITNQFISADVAFDHSIIDYENSARWKSPDEVVWTFEGKEGVDSEAYSRISKMTMKPDTEERRLINAALGLAGEGGEVADHVKKYVFHGHDLDVDHLIKELGDIQWYIVQACEAIGVTLGEVMRRNNEKLLRRYSKGFSTEASINRSE